MNGCPSFLSTSVQAYLVPWLLAALLIVVACTVEWLMRRALLPILYVEYVSSTVFRRLGLRPLRVMVGLSQTVEWLSGRWRIITWLIVVFALGMAVGWNAIPVQSGFVLQMKAATFRAWFDVRQWVFGC